MLDAFLRSRITYTPCKNKTSYKDKQIKCLAKFLHSTMHQVSRHSEMLYEMDTKMFIINKTLQDVMWIINVF